MGLSRPSVTKLNSSGVPQGTYTFSTDIGQFNAAVRDGLGNVYLGGFVGNGFTQAIIVKLDEATMTPSASWGDVGFGVGLRFYSVAASSNTCQAITMAPNGDVVAGISSNSDAALVRYTSSGNGSTVWPDGGLGAGVRRYDSGLSDTVRAVLLDADGRTYVGMTSASDIAVMKLDANGQVSTTWSNVGFGFGIRRYGMVAGQIDSIQGLILDPSKNVVAFGSSIQTAGDTRGTMVKFTTTGTQAWAYHFNTAATNDHFNDAVRTSTNNYVGVSTNGKLVMISGFDGTPSLNWQDDGHGLGVRQLPGTNPSGAGIEVDPFDTVYAVGIAGSPSNSCSFLAVNEEGAIAYQDTFLTGGSPSNTGVFVDASNKVYTSGNFFSGVRTAVGMKFTRYRLSGNVHLQDWEPRPQGMVVTIELRDIFTGAVLEAHQVPLDALGNYVVETLYRGRCFFACKTSHWLRQVIDGPGIPGGGAVVDFDLVNGDCDEDNEIGIGDYAQLSAAYGSTAGDANFDPMADLNGDDTVDIADYAILSANYGQVGDD